MLLEFPGNWQYAIVFRFQGIGNWEFYLDFKAIDDTWPDNETKVWKTAVFNTFVLSDAERRPERKCGN